MRVAGLTFALAIVVIGIATAALGLASPSLGLMTIDRYGPVRIALPRATPTAFVIYFSDGAWQASDDQVVKSLAAEGALTVGVDRPSYFARLTPPKTGCDQLLGDAEALSRRLQRRLPGADYLFPILAGSGESGALAGAILEQAPPRTIGGVLTIDPTESLAQPRALCAGAPAHEIDSGRFSYGAKAKPNGFWSAALSPALGLGSRQHLARLIAGGVPVERSEIPAATPAAPIFVSLLKRHEVAPSDALAHLPLIELPAAHGSDRLVIVLSGDGGWRDLDAVIAQRLQAEGLNVVGWDSLGYFWRRKTPRQTARDLAAVISTYAERWHARSIALVGYSFGANVLPAAYDDMPADVKARIGQMSLLALAQRGDWEIQVSSWFGADWGPNALPVAPDIARVPAAIIQCFYGSEDKTSACPSLDPKTSEIVEIPGGHHFDHDYVSLANRILAGFIRRTGGNAPPADRH